MKAIPTERKEAILAKMSGANRKSIPEISKDEGISTTTLYNWRKQARENGSLIPDYDDSPEGWSAQDKFNAVLETAALNEHNLSEYCRSKGLHTHQLKRWREACARANDWSGTENIENARRRREDAKRIEELSRELQRKEKALAEAAALLVLKKKVRELWAEDAVQ